MNTVSYLGSIAFLDSGPRGTQGVRKVIYSAEWTLFIKWTRPRRVCLRIRKARFHQKVNITHLFSLYVNTHSQIAYTHTHTPIFYHKEVLIVIMECNFFCNCQWNRNNLKDKSCFSFWKSVKAKERKKESQIQKRLYIRLHTGWKPCLVFKNLYISSLLW